MTMKHTVVSGKERIFTHNMQCQLLFLFTPQFEFVPHSIKGGYTWIFHFVHDREHLVYR